MGFENVSSMPGNILGKRSNTSKVLESHNNIDKTSYNLRSENCLDIFYRSNPASNGCNEIPKPHTNTDLLD